MPLTAALFDLLDDGLAVFDAGHRLRHRNARFCALLDAPPDAFAQGESLPDVAGRVARQCRGAGRDFARELAATLAAPRPGAAPLECVTRGGRRVAIDLRTDADGEALLCVRDVGRPQRAAASDDSAVRVAVTTLADLAEYRDTDTSEHVLRVARLTHELARELAASGCAEAGGELLAHIGAASILHDIGKVGVPDSILLKRGWLDPDERAVIERHAEDGGTILRKASRLLSHSAHFRLAAEIAHSHHERWDGTGYPQRLAGEDIPLGARIVAVADVFDALSSPRPYKDAWPQADVMAYMREQAGRQFDARVIDALERVMAVRESAGDIEWNAAMSLGDPLIDHDHGVLLMLINQLGLEANRRDPIAVEFVLDELVRYTLSHFGREEQLLEARGYPDLARHRALHRRMADEVGSLRERLRDGFTPGLGDELAGYLKDWLGRHILGEDALHAAHHRASSAG